MECKNCLLSKSKYSLPVLYATITGAGHSNLHKYLYTKGLGLFCAVIVTNIYDNNVQAPILTSSFQTSSHCWRFHWSVCYKLSRLSFPIKSGSCSIAGRWLKIMKNSNLTITTINLIEMVDLKMMW